MKLELECRGPEADGSVAVRLLVLNDSYEPVEVDRRLLLGPHPSVSDPPLLSTEHATDDESKEIVLLNPWGLYGRERRFQYDAGSVTFHGYLLRQPADGLLPTGPADATLLLVAAPPLAVDFDSR